MMPVVPLLQALSRLDPVALTLHNDADDLEVVARGVSLDDPTLPPGSSAALDALRAVLDEALSTGCALVEVAVQAEQSSRARWRRSLARPPEVTFLEPFALTPSVRVRLRESFGLGVLGDALGRRRPEHDALRRAMLAPRVPVEGITPLQPPLASVALAFLRAPFRGALELMPQGTAPTLVRSVEGYAWREDPLWRAHEHRPPVRIWIDAPWPTDFDALPAPHEMPLPSAWRALADDARQRLHRGAPEGTPERPSLDGKPPATVERLRRALQETVAAAVLRSGRVELQRAPHAPQSGAATDVGSADPTDAWFPGADALRPLLHAYLFHQRGFAEKPQAIYDDTITLAESAAVAATTTAPLRFVDAEAPAGDDRSTRTIRAHLSSPTVKALASALQAQADDALARHRAEVEAWRGDASVVATLAVDPSRGVPPGAVVVVVAVSPARDARPVEVTVARSGTYAAPQVVGPALTTELQPLGAWRILVRVGDGATPSDADAVTLALRHLADPYRGGAALTAALTGQVAPTRLAPLRTHLAGVAFGLDPASVLDLGLTTDGPGPGDHEAGLRVWVGLRPGSVLRPGNLADFRAWISSHLQDSARRELEGTAALFNVGLATLQTARVEGSDAVDPDETWAVLVGQRREARVVPLRGWPIQGWVVARDVGPEGDVARWRSDLALRIRTLVERVWEMGETSTEQRWRLWLILAAVARQAGTPKVHEALDRVEREPFVRVLDARNHERWWSLSMLQRSRETVRGWWWRELAPGERWREAAGVFLREGTLTAEVLQEIEARLGLTLTRGVVEAAVDAGPTQWRVTDDNARALLSLAATPGTAALVDALREALRAWMGAARHELGDLLDAARAAKVWPTPGGAYVSALDHPPGEAPSVEFRCGPLARRHPGRDPCIVVSASREDIYREVIHPTTREEAIEHDVVLRSPIEAGLLNRLLAPTQRVPELIVFSAED